MQYLLLLLFTPSLCCSLWAQTPRINPIHRVEYSKPPVLENHLRQVNASFDNYQHLGINLHSASSRVHRILSQAYCPWLCEIEVESEFKINNLKIICDSRLVKDGEKAEYHHIIDGCNG